MSFFDFLFGGDDQQSPSSAAMPYFDKIPGTVKPYYDPFIEQGKQASDIANPVYQRMTQNPQEFLESMMRSYNPSSGYNFKERNMNRASQNAAAQGGYAGTPQSQLEQSQMVQGLLGEDMQQYLSNLFGIQGAGLQGQEQRIGRGFNASGNLADILAGNLAQQGNLAYQGQAQTNQNEMDRGTRDANFLGDIFKTAGSIFGGGLPGFGGSGGSNGSGGGQSRNQPPANNQSWGRSGGAYSGYRGNARFGEGFF